MKITVGRAIELSNALGAISLRGAAAFKLALLRNELERVAKPARESLAQVQTSLGAQVQADGLTVEYPNLEARQQADLEFLQIRSVEVEIACELTRADVQNGMDERVVYDTVALSMLIAAVA